MCCFRGLIVAWAVAAMLLPAGPAGAQYLWCWDGDEVFAEVEGTAVTFHHKAAVYNCCLNPMEYTLFQEDGRLVVQEREILINGCWCICCYDLRATFNDFEPGDWSVLFRWEDEESAQMMEVEVAFTVAGNRQGAQLPGKDGYWKSECLMAASAVPDEAEPGPGDCTWDALKALYR